MSPAAADLVTSLLEPIPGPNPVGLLLDIDSEGDLLWLQDTIEKTTAFGEGDVDWAGVLERSRKLLAGRSKDWSLACYLARAMHHLDGYPGLVAGLRFLQETLQRYWKEMYPALPAGARKRANLLEWLISGLADDVARRPAKAADLEAVTTARAELAKLDEALDERLGAAYPGVRLLREALSRQEELARPGQPEAAPTAEAAAPSEAPAPSAEGEFPPPIDSPEKADDVLGRCRQGIFAAADALVSADATSAQAFRLRRLAAWIYLDAAPPAEEGRIAAPGPDEGESDRLRSILAQDARGVLEEVENRLPAYPLWLDLQQLACAALARLGPAHATAREAVTQETRALLSRLPGLADLQFANGVPLADATTRAWVDEEVREGEAPEPAAPGRAAAAPGDDRLEQAVRKAAELAGQGEVEKSLQLFHDGLKTVAGGRDRFLWRLAAARHLSRVGQAPLALDLLGELDREAAERGLETWEPDLFVEVLQAALQVGKKGKAKKGPPLPIVTERMPDLPKRLARLDLVAALRISSKER